MGGGNTLGSDISPEMRQGGGGGGGFVGSLIGFNELDSEVADVIKKGVKDVDYLLMETESLRALYRDLVGLSKNKVDQDLANMRTEVRQGIRSLIEVSDNIQSLINYES